MKKTHVGCNRMKSNDRLNIYQFSRWDSRELELTMRYKFNTAKNRYKGNGVGQGEINRM